MSSLLERTFQLQEHGTSVRTEVLAGLTTLLTMAYILFVNPMILGSTGMPKEAVPSMPITRLPWRRAWA